MPTIHAVPSSFAITSPATNQVVTFALPAGTWTAGTWTLTATHTGTITNQSVKTSPSNSSTTLVAGTVAASAGQLTDINAAAGGSLTVTLTDVGIGFVDTITDFTLALTGTPASPSSFTVTPPTQTVRPRALSGVYTITLNNPAITDESFSLSDGGRGGQFYPPTAVVLAGASTATFSYLNPVSGADTLTVAATTSPSLGLRTVLSLVTNELPGFDVRLYDANGLRKALPRVNSVNFEVLDSGGYGRGSFECLSLWEDFDLSGTERVDVYYGDNLVPVYRGYVRIPERAMDGSGERAHPTLYGLMELMNTYLLRRRYSYSAPVDISVLFTAIVTDDLQITGRLPSLELDIQTIGVTVQQFDAFRQSLRSGFDGVAHLAPNQCYWGFDVVLSGGVYVDRLYLRPKDLTTIVYKLTVKGGTVDSLTESRDYGQIVNTLFIAGGKVAQPNLLTNGSFENPLPNSETVGNLLLNYSFEDGSTSWTITGTVKTSPGDFPGVTRTGVKWLECDSAGEKGEQKVAISYLVPYTASVWARREDTTIANTFTLEVEGLNAANAVVTTITVASAQDPGSGSAYVRYTGTCDFSAFPTVTQAMVRGKALGGTASNDGIIFDDFALYEKNGVSNSGWKYTLAGAATRAQLDWQEKTLPSVDTEPWHGGYAVKAQGATIALGTDYLMIGREVNARPSVKAQGVYSVVVHLRANALADAMNFKMGIQEYKADGTTNGAAQLSAAFTDNAVAWTTYSTAFTMAVDTVAVDVFVRIFNNNIHHLDGFMLIEGRVPAEFSAASLSRSYWEAENYELKIDTDNSDLDTLTPVALSADAQASIATYGEKEGLAQSSAVVDYDTGKAFAVGYFNQHALPQIQLPVTIKNPTSLVTVDGAVKLINLDGAPDVAYPSRVSTTFSAGGDVTQEIELGNARPEMSDLLVLTAERAKQGILVELG